jgi:hypothetical protein
MSKEVNVINLEVKVNCPSQVPRKVMVRVAYNTFTSPSHYSIQSGQSLPIMSTSPSASPAAPGQRPKKSKAAEQARNTVNQRRLRERRKEYIEELETKVRTFEQQGVQATQAIQKAARVVVEENKVLRRMLAEMSVDESRIRDYMNHELSSQGTHEGSRQTSIVVKQDVSRGQEVPVRSQLPSVELPPMRLAPLPTIPQLASPHQLPPLSSITSEHYPELFSQSESTVLPRSHVGHEADQAPFIPSRPATTPPHVEETRRTCGIDETDCVEAARIITSLRGGLDPEDVWPELGCSRTQRTSVKNTVLMSLV